jgi:hypothetical protein
MECKFCKNIFSTKSGLNTHMTTAKYCLKIQGKNKTTKYKCENCNKYFSTTTNLNRHHQKCNVGEIYKEEIKSITLERDNFKNQILEYKYKLEEKDYQIKEQKQTIHQLQDKLENIAIKAVQRPNFEQESTIEINEDDFISDSNFTIEESDNEEEYKQLQPLEVGKGFTIDHREEDGYVNVTNLCKAGNKRFKAWNRLEKTRAFLRVLSRSVLISTDLLIKTQTGGLNENRGTWVHPQVAINIAQWISPAFDVKVSGWVYEIMMTGKVDITNTTSFKKIQEENKGHKLRIQYLTKKYVKAQSRVQYKEEYVIYVLTTALMKKERRYILGKATNLTSRLSVYNKSDEHEVVYYQECGDEEIKFFSEKINKSINFFKK